MALGVTFLATPEGTFVGLSGMPLQLAAPYKAGSGMFEIRTNGTTTASLYDGVGNDVNSVVIDAPGYYTLTATTAVRIDDDRVTYDPLLTMVREAVAALQSRQGNVIEVDAHLVTRERLDRQTTSSMNTANYLVDGPWLDERGERSSSRSAAEHGTRRRKYTTGHTYWVRLVRRDQGAGPVQRIIVMAYPGYNADRLRAALSAVN